MDGSRNTVHDNCKYHLELDNDPTWESIKTYASTIWMTKLSDSYMVANQNLWKKHCLRNENKPGTCNTKKKLSVKEVIPNSKLNKCYGQFYYNHNREKVYKADENKDDAKEQRCKFRNCTRSELLESWNSPEVQHLYRMFTSKYDRK